MIAVQVKSASLLALVVVGFRVFLSSSLCLAASTEKISTSQPKEQLVVSESRNLLGDYMPNNGEGQFDGAESSDVSGDDDVSSNMFGAGNDGAGLAHAAATAGGYPFGYLGAGGYERHNFGTKANLGGYDGNVDARGDADDDESAADSDDEGSGEDESRQVFRGMPGSYANLRGQDTNIENARIALSAQDMQTAAGHHHKHKHYVHGKLDMGAYTGKKGSFGWHDKHPVGGKGRR